VFNNMVNANRVLTKELTLNLEQENWSIKMALKRKLPCSLSESLSQPEFQATVAVDSSENLFFVQEEQQRLGSLPQDI
jgi:hypothetical protein